MPLLDLTEKEAEVVRNALIKEKYSWEDANPKDISETTIENNKTLCNKIWAKLDDASQSQQDILITSKDLFDIKSLANGEYRKLRADLKVSYKRVEQIDFVHISLANALISWLNGKNLLKKLARFDFTDDSAEYEENE